MDKRTKTLRGAFINTGEANCSIFESGKMVYNCIGQSDVYSLDYFSLDQIDLAAFATDGSLVRMNSPAPAIPATAFDFWVFNWHFITMAMHVDPAIIAKLPGKKFTIVLELAPEDPLQLVPKGVFDGHLALDPGAPVTNNIFPFPRPLEGDARTPSAPTRPVPVIGSFGFGTPGKGFELLIEAVNRCFDRAVVRVNIPSGDYIGSDIIHKQNYPRYIADICARIAKPGVEVRFTYDFMTPEGLMDWCGENDINCFMYTRRQPGLSATTDQAIISGRPLLTLSNDTFRHIHRYIPPYPLIDLNQALIETSAQVQRMQQDWSREAFNQTFLKMLAEFGLTQDPATNPDAPIHNRARKLLVITPGVLGTDIRDYNVRLTDALERTAQFTLVRTACGRAADISNVIAARAPDAVLLLGYNTEELRALAGVASPVIAVCRGAAPGGVAIRSLPARPIIPFFTVNTGLADNPAIWLLGYGNASEALDEVALKLSRETPDANILIALDGPPVGHLTSRIEHYRQNLGLTIAAEPLPQSGADVLNLLAQGQLVIVHNDGSQDVEDLCSLALITERAVVFTRWSPFADFADKATYIEEHHVEDLRRMGVSAHIGILHDFGEWQSFAAIANAIESEITDRPTSYEITSPPPTKRLKLATPALAHEAFVTKTFQEILGRAPDPAGRDHFVNRLLNGEPRAAIWSAIRLSEEAQLRNPTLAFRMEKYRIRGSGWLRRKINALLGRPSPYHVTATALLALHGEPFVRAAYQAVLGRAPDPDGLRHQLDQIANGVSRNAILARLRQSPEGMARAAAFPGLGNVLRRDKLVRSRPWGSIFRGLGLDRDRVDVARSLRVLENDVHRLVSNSMTDNSMAPVVEATRPQFSEQTPTPASVATLLSPKVAVVARAANSCVYLLAGITWRRDVGPDWYSASLIKAWTSLGRDIRVVHWEPDAKRFEVAHQQALRSSGWADVLRDSLSNHPLESDAVVKLDKESCSAADWLVTPCPVRLAGDPPYLVEAPIIIEARRLGLRNGFIFHGAGPLRISSGSVAEVQAHEQYMQALLLADAIFPTSTIADTDLVDFFSHHQSADYSPFSRKVPFPAILEQADAVPWLEHARLIESALKDADDDGRNLTSLYWLQEPDGLADPVRQQFAEQLAKSLKRKGISLIPVVWSAKLQDFEPGNIDPHSQSNWISPSEHAAPKWVLAALGPAFWFAEGRDVRSMIGAARSHRLRISAILHPSVTGHTEAEFETLAQLDKVFALTKETQDDFNRFLLSKRFKLYCADDRFQMLSAPFEVADRGRVIARPKPPEMVRKFVLDRDISTFGAPFMAALKAVALDNPNYNIELSTPSLSVRGSSSRKITKQDLPANVRCLDWQPTKSCDDDREIDVATFALIHEATPNSLELLQRCLWRGVPCIVDRGLNIEPSPGIQLVDFSVEDEVRTAFQKALDPYWCDAMSKEATARPTRTWLDFANELLTALATDRLVDATIPLARRANVDVYSSLINLKPRPKLSLCISTYNRAGWLGVNLRNIFRQIPEQRDDLEVLVVDNTSPDDTPEVVKPYLHRGDFTYIRNPVNVGMLGNLAVTAQRARGEYIWILGDDDLTRDGAIERVLEIISEKPSIGLIYVNYGYTTENDPSSVGDLDHFLNNFNILQPECDDEYSTVKQLAAKTENFYTAIYSHIYRRDHGMRSYCQDTSGRIFSTMRSCIPTTYHVLNYMSEETAYWIGRPSLVVNSNVSWADYGALLDLEQLPAAWDLAERMGTPPEQVDMRRANRLWLVEMMWRDIFENDKVGNSAYFSAPRVIMRLKHLPEFEKYVPEFRAIYQRAHDAGNPAASMPPRQLFAAFD